MKKTGSVTYQTFRPLLAGILISVAIGTVGFLFYRELTSPLRSSYVAVNDTLPPKSDLPQQSSRFANVPPDQPKILSIPVLGITAPIRSLGITKEGALDAPGTAWEAGWYNKSALPGHDGAILLDGHVNDSFNTPGVFATLKTLEPGASIIIERGDGQQFAYTVKDIEAQPTDKVDMDRLLRPYEGAEGLNLITCGGSYNRKTGTFNDRILVFAIRS